MKVITHLFAITLSAWTLQPAIAQEQPMRAKVTGIGGVFFHTNQDDNKLAKWYEEHLGISLETWGGAIIEWQKDQAEDGGLTVWHVTKADSGSYAPSKSSFMINYRVDDLEKLVAQLKSANIKIVKEPEHHENGSFAWIMDPEGNMLELWEPKLWDEKNKR